MSKKIPSKGTRQTFYFKDLDAIRNLAEDENMEINGSTFEELFWRDQVGEDVNFKSIARNMYSNDSKLSDRLQDVLNLMAYNEQYMNPNNVKFIQIIRDSLINSSWNDNEKNNYSDYRISNKESYVDSLSYIIRAYVQELEHRKNFVHSSPLLNGELEPWDMPVNDKRYVKILTNKDNYTDENIAHLKFIANNFEAGLKAANSPKEVVALIISNWDYLWNFSSTYEAVEYCVVLSNKVIDNALIKRNIRDFFKNFNSDSLNILVEYIMNQPRETTDALGRLAAYSNFLNKK